MIRRPPRSTLSSSSAASDVYKRQGGDDNGGDDVDDDVSSVNSKDLADEEFMQGFREEVLGPRIAEMQEEITLLKKEAVRLMKEVGDKPAALDALRRAKQLEVELVDLQK
eukprot:TRINITY_DN37087_c0_g1_i1.p2 TRINITY_DN37087_c0_g1~~TRINITY_DN37087_c0_g1_i1.p2  ORF type:complete len:110 (+),score=29.31 TRINITY_DN37087_c0_g1_i1:92-421(+)